MVLGTTYDVLLGFHIQDKAESPQHSNLSINETTFNRISQNEILSESEDDADGEVQVIQLNTKRQQVHQQITTTLEEDILENKLQKEVEKLGWLGHFLFSFSTITNLKNLFNVEPEKEQIQCLHGLRVLSILAIIYLHNWVFLMYYIDNVGVLPEISETVSFSLMYHGTPFAVDTFFLMSGLLLSHSHLKKVEENKSVSWFKFYRDRLLRLSPSYWFTTFVLVFGLFLRQKFGPFDIPRSYFIETCKENWWRSILYISNSIPYTETCYLVDWYLAADMQFHWLSPILLYLMINNKWLAAGLASITVLASSVTSAMLAKDHDIGMSAAKDSTSALRSIEGIQHYMAEIYIKPYCRITPFIFGMMVGWLLIKTKLKIYFHKFQILLLWSLAFACFIGAVLIPYYFALNRTTTSVYISVMYILWSITTSIVIILCSTGNGGIMNSFLSWSGWLPFSRLSYGVYLTHAMVLIYFNSVKERSLHLSFPFFNMNFMCVVISCFVFSTLLYLTIESPFENLRKRKTSKTVKP